MATSDDKLKLEAAVASGVDLSAVARIRVLLEGVAKGTRRAVNLIAGTGVTLDATDDAGNERIDITITADSGGTAPSYANVSVLSGDWRGTGAETLAAAATALQSDKAATSHTHTASQVSDFSTAADARVAAALGVSVQAYSAKTAAIAALTWAADKLVYLTGTATAAVADLTSFARTLLDDADATTARATLGLVIGTDVQGYSAKLAAIVGLTWAADKVAYFTSASAAAVADLTSYGRSVIAAADASALRTLAGLVIGTDVQAYSAKTAAIAALTWAADSYAYFTSASAAAIGTITTFGRSLVDDADASAARTTLGVVIGTDVQAYSAKTAAIAALTWAADSFAYFTSSSAAAVATVTSYARTLLDDTDASTARGTLGLGTMATQGAGAVAITGGSVTGITDLAVADGGTGSSTAAAARTALGVDVEEMNGHIETPTAKTYTLIEKAQYACTINSLAYKLSAGTATLAVQIAGVNVTSLSSLSATTTQGETSATGAQSVAAGNRVTLIVTSPSSAADLAFTLKTTR